MPSPCVTTTRKFASIQPSKPNMLASLVVDEWCVEVEAMPIIVIHTCWRHVGVMATVSQHSHTFHAITMRQNHSEIANHFSPSQILRTHYLGIDEWIVEAEVGPTSGDHICWRHVKGMTIISQHSCSNGNLSILTNHTSRMNQKLSSIFQPKSNVVLAPLELEAWYSVLRWE